MKRRVAECLGCEKEKEIYALKRCGPCYVNLKRHEAKEEGKCGGIKGFSKKAAAKINEDTEFYNEIWSKRVHHCEECGDFLGDTWARFHFSHIISKGSYPQLRHVEGNINLLCLRHHNQWETGDRKNMRIWEKNEKKIVELKRIANGIV